MGEQGQEESSVHTGLELDLVAAGISANTPAKLAKSTIVRIVKKKEDDEERVIKLKYTTDGMSN